MKRLIALLAFAGLSFGQSLTLGLYGREGYLTPTLEAGLQLEEFSLSARLQRDAFGLGVGSALELGPAGRLAYGLEGAVGFAGWLVVAFAKGGVGQVGLEAALGYASTLRRSLWVAEDATSGLSAKLAAKYRLDSKNTLGLSTAYSTAAFSGEASYALRQDSTYTFGLGYRAGFYGLVGWKGEVDQEGTLLDVTLYAGQYNRLEAALFMEQLKARLMLAYPWAGSVGIEMNPFRFDIGYDNAWYAWLRYSIDLGGNE